MVGADKLAAPLDDLALYQIGKADDPPPDARPRFHDLDVVADVGRRRRVASKGAIRVAIRRR